MDEGPLDFDTAMLCCYQIPGWLWPSEQGELYHLFHESKTHAEVGVSAGRSLFATCAGFEEKCDVTAVDLWTADPIGGEWIHDVFKATAARIEQMTHAHITMMRLSSMEAFRVLSQSGRRFDSVFVDACHEYAEVKQDIEAWSSLLAPNGIIAGHDYWATDPGVMDAVNETGPFHVIPETRIWYRIIS